MPYKSRHICKMNVKFVILDMIFIIFNIFCIYYIYSYPSNLKSNPSYQF